MSVPVNSALLLARRAALLVLIPLAVNVTSTHLSARLEVVQLDLVQILKENAPHALWLTVVPVVHPMPSVLLVLVSSSLTQLLVLLVQRVVIPVRTRIVSLALKTLPTMLLLRLAKDLHSTRRLGSGLSSLLYLCSLCSPSCS
jgi:hypothetical protein